MDNADLAMKNALPNSLPRPALPAFVSRGADRVRPPDSRPSTPDSRDPSPATFQGRLTALAAGALLVGALLAGALVSPLHATEENLLAILATVNGEPITLYDVLLDTRRQEQQLAAAERPADLPQSVRQLRHQAVERLIDRRLLFAEFEQRSYRVPEQMIEDLLNELAADYAGGSREDLAKRAAADGMTMPELRAKARERVAVDLLIEDVCHRSVYITPAQILAHYEQHPEQFAEPERFSLQILMLRRDGKLAAHPPDFPDHLRDELANADQTKFNTMVRLYSDDPNRTADGRLGWLTRDELRLEFVAALAEAKPGAILGPLTLAEGICFLRLDQHLPAQQFPFAIVKDQIRAQLELAERQDRYRRLTERLRSRAVIRTFFTPWPETAKAEAEMSDVIVE